MGEVQAIEPDIETDCLIIGAGPAGASLACFLINYGMAGKTHQASPNQLTYLPGVRVLMISDAKGTSATPRAHLINMAGLGKQVRPKVHDHKS
jgi:hypothetical protein